MINNIKKPIDEEYVLYKAQIHKQLAEMNKFVIDDLMKYINDNSNSCVNNSQYLGNSKSVKSGNTTGVTSNINHNNKNIKKKKGMNKKQEKKKVRKNSEEISIDKFLKNIKNHSIPNDKIVKIKNSNLTKNWAVEMSKKS